MKVSVVIPCRNEKKHIRACVEAIFANTLAQRGEVEVLLVDGMSDDGTRDEIQKLTREFPQLRLVDNPAQVTPVAFNLGIRESRGEYVQIIGARQIVSPDYLEGAVACFVKNPDIWCVGGRVENTYENNESQIIANAMNTPFGVGGGNFRIVRQSAFVDTVGTPMYPRRVFEKVGLFDEELIRNQDDEFNYRVTRAGGKIYLNADIVIRYLVRADHKKLYKQYYQYGYWKVFVNRKHGAVTTLRQLFPSALLLFLAGGALLSIFSVYILIPYLAVVLLYLLLALYFAIKASEKPAHIPATVKTFLVLHFGYGAGYLKGILDFLLLNRRPSSQNQTLSR